MYRVAITKAVELGKTNAAKGERLESTAICNYACFVCRHRKDPLRALGMFDAALIRYVTSTFDHFKLFTNMHNLMILLNFLNLQISFA